MSSSPAHEAASILHSSRLEKPLAVLCCAKRGWQCPRSCTGWGGSAVLCRRATNQPTAGHAVQVQLQDGVMPVVVVFVSVVECAAKKVLEHQ
jgi:hypothetical protein